MAYLKEATCKIFAHGTSFFSIAKNDKLSQNNLNSDLKKKMWMGLSVENAF